MNKIKEYFTVEIFIILPLLFLIVCLIVILTTNGQLDLGDFEWISVFTFFSSIGTLAAAYAALKAVNTNLTMYEEQKKENIESFLPLFEVESKGSNGNFVSLYLINRNLKPISVFQTGSNSKNGKMDFHRKEVNTFWINVYGDYKEHDVFSIWLHYKTLDRKTYAEQIKFRIVERNIVIEEQIVRLI